MAQLTVNYEQVQRIGQRLRELDWRSAGYDVISAACPAGLDRAGQIDYFFYTSMLLFDFKNVAATLPDGRVIKGTDVFFYLARRAGEREPDFWTAAGLLRQSDTDFYRAFAYTDDPAQPALARMDERIALLRDAAHKLQTLWGGSASNLLSAGASLESAPPTPGLLEQIRTFEGYSDPLYKKVFVFLKALDVLKLWQPLDPQNAKMPVDYHVIRLALRNGTVTVQDAALAEALRNGAVVDAATEHVIREAVMQAYHALLAETGLSVYFVDEVFWLLGRSCCHYLRPPRCNACDFSECGVQPAFSYTCPGVCPLATVCLGAGDTAYKTLLEPNIVTTFY